MPVILVAADAEWLVEEISAALSGPECEVISLRRGLAVRPYLEEHSVDLVVLDMQIANMGGMAVCQELRLEERAGRLERIPVLMLLDRRADVFLARRVDAEGWLVKPLDPIRLRRAFAALMEGGTYYDGSYSPMPVLIPVPTRPGSSIAEGEPALSSDPPAALVSSAAGTGASGAAGPGSSAGASDGIGIAPGADPSR